MVKIIKNIDYKTEGHSVKQLIGNHLTVVIRNKSPIKPEQLIAFYKTIGNVAKQNKKVTGTVSTGELVKVRQNGLFAGKDDGELEWHSAGMNRHGHDDIVAMYMHQTAESGGDTYFTDHQTAWNDLDEDTKNLCRSLKSKTPTYNDRMKLDRMGIYKNVFSDEQTMMEFRDINGNTSFESQVPRKDLVTKHPINGKEGLYYPWTIIRGFSGQQMNKDAQHDLYFKLKEHTLQEKYIYSHKWEKYDIVLSDQHHSLHRRDAYNGDRELWRAGIWLRSEDKSSEAWSCESLMPQSY
jgi:taurine dioxygenase